ncbi:Ubiquitin-conjugating enzyme E2 J1 [Chytriomyces hyalinus]|nr:Ubiquitin-conjugating enzyme E2 J1 [Chytriomyces hyalinus]
MSRSAAVKRLMKEFADLEADPSPDFIAYPISDSNVFEWHFTLRGPNECGFTGGKYHGRIVFPADYPFKPPDMYFLTPNGRFELNKKICLSITGFHAETWRPAWGIRSALTALISFFPTEGNGAIGALDWTPDERAIYAKKSLDWVCTGICERCEGVKMRDLLTDALLESGLERKKVDGADEIKFTVKASTENIAESSAATPNVSEVREVTEASSAARESSPVRPIDPSLANEGLRNRGTAASAAATDAPNRIRTDEEPQPAAPGAGAQVAQPPVSTAPQAPAQAAVVLPQLSPEWQEYHARLRRIDTVILMLGGGILYIVLRRLGILFG